jgi:hypothetical protein
MVFCRRGASKLGTFEGGAAAGARSSTTLNEMISTMLDTSFLTLSGKLGGRLLPVKLKLHRYIASANSGNRSWPDFVVSDRIHICESTLPGSFDRRRRSFALSPSNAWALPTALLNNCSNFAWSVAVMNDSRIFGILPDCLFWVGRGGRAFDPVLNDCAICEDVCWGRRGAAGACCGCGGC